MLVLAIDTSSAAVTAAVVDVSGSIEVLAQRVTVNARAHGELLAPSIAACLDESGHTAADLRAVVAGVGPGPFTGLRVGLVTASVFGAMLKITTYGVCSLDAIGAAYPQEPSLLVATDARRKEVYWAHYRNGVRTDGPDVAKPNDVAVTGIRAAAGSGTVLYDFGVPVLELSYPPVAQLVECAADRIRAGAPAESLTPLYLRRPDAVANPVVKPVTQ